MEGNPAIDNGSNKENPAPVKGRKPISKGSLETESAVNSEEANSNRVPDEN